MDLTSKLKEWTLAYIGEGPLLLVDFSVVQGAKRTLITILVDTLEGVTIDECALMSRKLAHFIEEGMLIEEAYNLEVSSPGLDFPLSQLHVGTMPDLHHALTMLSLKGKGTAKSKPVKVKLTSDCRI